MLVVEVTTPRPVGQKRLVRIRSIPTSANATPREAEVESEFLWPLARGRDVERFALCTSERYVIVAHDPSDLSSVLTVDELAGRAPHLFDYLEPWIERLAQRSPYAELRPTPSRPWGIQGPWSHLRRNANLVLCRYMHPRGRPPAAVAVARTNPQLARVTTVYPNNKSNFVAVASEAEAWFIASFINSAPAQDAISRFVSTTTIGPAALQRLPIPRFDPDDAAHTALSDLGRKVAIGEADLVELDGVVRQVAI
jgi:hypothetical protein